MVISQITSSIYLLSICFDINVPNLQKEINNILETFTSVSEDVNIYIYIYENVQTWKITRCLLDDFFISLNYLPMLNVSVFQSENIKPLSGRMNF